MISPSDAFAQLKARVEYLIDHARAAYPLGGVTAYTPVAFGTAYKALYLRDFTYMAESAPEFIPSDHIQKILALFVSHITREGLCPERISDTGEVIYVCHGPRPAGDCAMFLVKLAAAYADNGHDPKFIDTIYPALCRTIDAVPIDPATGLVYIDPAAPSTAYGFTDTIAITGQHLFCSLLLYESRRTLERFARLLNQDATRHTDHAARIRKNLGALWSPTDNLFLAGSQDCRQPDIWGSAYACAISAIDPPRRQVIADSLWQKKGRFLFRGQVRHLLTPDHWQKLILDVPETQPGNFQNGAYWGTATGWVAETFEPTRPGAGIKLLTDLVQDFHDHGVWECIGPAGYQRIENNVSSACLPYASFKRLTSQSERP
ncbi:MAG TPA: hypothetical protein VFE58_14280 [Tepidisphaeraceae bacterium]|jgi:hypothetical protein|nr:hypothetical protein [Tepidisphaeraceae bacterium]